MFYFQTFFCVCFLVVIIKLSYFSKCKCQKKHDIRIIHQTLKNLYRSTTNANKTNQTDALLCTHNKHITVRMG